MAPITPNQQAPASAPEPKKWYASKTLWIATAIIVANGVQAFAAIPELQQYPQIVGGATAVAGALLFVLRFVSTSQLTK